MTNYTSLETSKRLYEAFGWWDVNFRHEPDLNRPMFRRCESKKESDVYITSGLYPAFDSDYLLEKLPSALDWGYDNTGALCLETYINGWSASYSTIELPDGNADTPSEALGLLALKLREDGLL